MKIVYYWITKVLLNIRTNDTPYWNALLIIWLLQALNLGLLYGLIRLLFSINPIVMDNLLGIIVIALFLLVVNYFWLFRNRKKIFEKYDRMNNRKSNLSQLIVWIYVIASIVLFFVVIANFEQPVKDPIKEHIKEIRKQN